MEAGERGGADVEIWPGTTGGEMDRQRHTGRHLGQSAVSFPPSAERL